MESAQRLWPHRGGLLTLRRYRAERRRGAGCGADPPWLAPPPALLSSFSHSTHSMPGLGAVESAGPQRGNHCPVFCGAWRRRPVGEGGGQPWGRTPDSPYKLGSPGFSMCPVPSKIWFMQRLYCFKNRFKTTDPGSRQRRIWRGLSPVKCSLTPGSKSHHALVRQDVSEACPAWRTLTTVPGPPPALRWTSLGLKCLFLKI